MTQTDRVTFRRILKDMDGTVFWNEPLSRHTSLKIGGPADLIVMPKTVETLQLLMVRSRQERIPLAVLGGTNLLVRDGGIRGIVVKLTHLNKIRKQGREILEADGGALVSRVARYASEHSLKGMEFALGIPGTVGGGVAMNAGTREGEMADILTGIHLIDHKGRMLDLKRSEMEFGYRWSRLPRGIIVAVRMKLKEGSKAEIQQRMRYFINYRKMTQPLQLPNAGSIFKNSNGHFAAKLIESVGLKGCQIGDAQVSGQHANFIVNRGNATARDVLRLIRLVGRRVEDETGVTLELELKIVGRD